MKRFWVILAAFLGLAATAVPASADIVYKLSQGGSILQTPGDYGTVTVSQSASDTIRVQIDLAAGERFVSAGHDGIVFSLSNSSNLTDIRVTSANKNLFAVQNQTSGPQAPFFPTGSFKDSPFLGPFEYAITWKGNGASTATESSITFDLKFGSNILLSPSLFDLVSGTYFAVDIGSGCTTNPNNGKVSCAFTGAVASGPPTQVPEPGTVTMSIAGLMGVAGLMRLRRRRKLASA